MNRLEGRKLEGVLTHGLTHRPGNNISQMNIEKEILQKNKQKGSEHKH